MTNNRYDIRGDYGRCDNCEKRNAYRHATYRFYDATMPDNGNPMNCFVLTDGWVCSICDKELTHLATHAKCLAFEDRCRRRDCPVPLDE